MNHLEAWELEKASEQGDSNWENFCDEVELLTGLDNLDADEAIDDGFHVDWIYEGYKRGLTPEQTVAECARNDLALFKCFSRVKAKTNAGTNAKIIWRMAQLAQAIITLRKGDHI